jgi:methyl coenzyme M reductase alpha subunit
MLSAQPRPIPCAAMNTDHGVVPTRWGAHQIRMVTVTLGARVGAAAVSASFATATISATVIVNIVPGSRPALDTICNASLIFCHLNVCLQLGSLGSCTHQAE